jgi:hypothetical protein
LQKIMIARIALLIAAILLPIVIVWGGAGFVAWDWNPEHWDTAGRFFVTICGAFGLMISIPVTLATAESLNL